MLNLLRKWATPVLSRMWLPVAVAFGAFLLYVKGKKDAEVSFKTSRLKQELKERRVIDETVVNTDRDAAIKRLQSNGGLRD